MSKYSVLIPKGDYPSRNRSANSAGAVLYIDHHFNSGPTSASYCLMEVSSSVSYARSLNLAAILGNNLSSVIGNKNNGVKALRSGERGHVCIGACKMPAVISESLFVSNPTQAGWIKNPENRQRFAEAEAAAIRQFAPGGGLVALSVGHKYKTSSPSDRGGTEADMAEDIVMRVKVLLESGGGVYVPPAENPYPLLKYGSNGAAVVTLQNCLNKYGYGLSPDGDFGPKTKAAVIDFQNKRGLVPDGIVGPNTWGKLKDAETSTPAPVPTPVPPSTPPAPKVMPLVKKGSTGSVVRVLQTVLIKRGYRLSVDGVFGSKTRSAVIRFQMTHFLVPDGVVGPKTWKKLGY
jgi:peptidoglycan hydrolase-like protein with peptidoglycan-binding domain